MRMERDPVPAARNPLEQQQQQQGGPPLCVSSSRRRFQPADDAHFGDKSHTKRNRISPAQDE